VRAGPVAVALVPFGAPRLPLLRVSVPVLLLALASCGAQVWEVPTNCEVLQPDEPESCHGGETVYCAAVTPDGCSPSDATLIWCCP
jgi:hypothetical protein